MRPGNDKTSVLSNVTDRLSQPVSALSLAVFRIALGGMLVWDCWRFLRDDRIYRYYVEPGFNFTYPGFGWVQPLAEPWIYLAWLSMGLSALFVAAGLFYRVAIVWLTVSFTYFFLLDQAEYLNHFYLVILFLILMCFLPANRALSLDARLWPPREGPTVPYAAVFILRAQMEIMLIYAGLVKLTPDWLAGEPLGLWLRAQADDWYFGHLFQYDAVILAGTWGAIALHVIGAPLLLWQRTRLATFVVYCVFHMANAQFFNIGIFPWLTIAATTIFFAPDWPRQLLDRLQLRSNILSSTARPNAAAAQRPVPRIALVAMAAWIVVQIALPLRASFYPSEVRWTGEGHRYSWRMRIYDRQAEGSFIVTADAQEWVVYPEDLLTDRQASKMLVRPDMIHQFASLLKTAWQQAGYSDVQVRADILKSLNGRPMQRYIDPDVDLAAVDWNMFGTNDWIMPLQHDVWGAADNRALQVTEKTNQE